MAGFQDNREELGGAVQAERRTMGQGTGREKSHLMPSQKGPDLRLLSLTIQFRSLSSITFKPNKAQPLWPHCWTEEQLLGQEKSLQNGAQGHSDIRALAQAFLQTSPRSAGIYWIYCNTFCRDLLGLEVVCWG